MPAVGVVIAGSLIMGGISLVNNFMTQRQIAKAQDANLDMMKMMYGQGNAANQQFMQMMGPALQQSTQQQMMMQQQMFQMAGQGGFPTQQYYGVPQYQGQGYGYGY